MESQDYTAFENRTVEENVSFGLECRGVPKRVRREQALEWVSKVGLDPARDAQKYPSQLSGGMRQRVAIARTLILNPRIILMDEPFGALDPTTRMMMQDLLVKLWRDAEATVFFVTHSIEEAVYLGDRTYVISSAPGTILHEVPVPPPDRPAATMAQLIGGLRAEAQKRFNDLRMRCLEMRSIARAAQPVAGHDTDVWTPALDRLLYGFLRLLSQQNTLLRFLRATTSEELSKRL